MFFDIAIFPIFAYNSKTKEGGQKWILPLIVSQKKRSRSGYQILSITSGLKVVVLKHRNLPTLYSASHFGWDCQVSRLLFKIEPCGFHVPVLLFRETQVGLIRFCITVSVQEIQGDFGNWYFSDPSFISEVIRNNAEVKTTSESEFCVESSGVLNFFFGVWFWRFNTNLYFF